METKLRWRVATKEEVKAGKLLMLDGTGSLGHFYVLEYYDTATGAWQTVPLFDPNDQSA